MLPGQKEKSSFVKSLISGTRTSFLVANNSDFSLTYYSCRPLLYNFHNNRPRLSLTFESLQNQSADNIVICLKEKHNAVNKSGLMREPVLNSPPGTWCQLLSIINNSDTEGNIPWKGKLYSLKDNVGGM